MANESRSVRVDFEAELRYSTSSGSTDGGASSYVTLTQPGYLEADSETVRQWYDDSAQVLPGINKLHGRVTPSKLPGTIFELPVSDIDEMTWNEATGAVRLKAGMRKGVAALQPLHFTEREASIATAVELADMWFPTTERVRSDMPRSYHLAAYAMRAAMLAFAVLPLVLVGILIAIGAPIPIIAIFGAVGLLFALAGRAMMKNQAATRRAESELIAQGARLVTVTRQPT